MKNECQHEWDVTQRAQCSFEFTEAVCKLCGLKLLEGGLMDYHCFEDPTKSPES